MRSMAAEFPNVYIVCMFACCRQIFDPSVMNTAFDSAKKEEL